MPKKEEIISLLKSHFKEKAVSLQIDLAFLFGSYAKGIVKAESDADIAVVFSKEVYSQEEKHKLITDITLDLCGKLGVNVDVISIDEDFHKPALYYNAVVLGIPVFIRDRNRYLQIYNQSLFQMDDFELFGMYFQRQAAKSLLKEVYHG